MRMLNRLFAPYRKLATATLLCLLSGGYSALSCADIAVVVNPENSVAAMNEREVKDLFLGRFLAFPDGLAALPLDQPVKSKIRAQFYKQLTGKTVPQINAYWARLIFSGRATPPRTAASSEEIRQMVIDNRNAIAYVDSKHVTPDMHVVLTLKVPPENHTD